jgi:hypothetical protein
MGIFGSKKIVWVPENEKLKEKCADADSWAAKERSALVPSSPWHLCTQLCLCTNDGRNVSLLRAQRCEGSVCACMLSVFDMFMHVTPALSDGGYRTMGNFL